MLSYYMYVSRKTENDWFDTPNPVSRLVSHTNNDDCQVPYSRHLSFIVNYMYTYVYEYDSLLTPLASFDEQWADRSSLSTFSDVPPRMSYIHSERINCSSNSEPGGLDLRTWSGGLWRWLMESFSQAKGLSAIPAGSSATLVEGPFSVCFTFPRRWSSVGIRLGSWHVSWEE